MLLPKLTYTVMAQRLFWLLRVVTSLFIGAVILGESEAQLSWAAPPPHLVPSAARLALRCFPTEPLLQGGLPDPARMHPSL